MMGRGVGNKVREVMRTRSCKAIYCLACCSRCYVCKKVFLYKIIIITRHKYLKNHLSGLKAIEGTKGDSRDFLNNPDKRR